MGDLMHLLDSLSLSYPDHGFVCLSPADRWEDGSIVGSGTVGALSFCRPHREEIVLSHEELFLPIYPAGGFFQLAPHLEHIREMVLSNRGAEAMRFTMDLAREAGYERRTLTDPFVGACSLRVSMEESSVDRYARSVDFATGDSVTAWSDASGIYHRRVFASRARGVVAIEISSPTSSPISASLSLARIERDLDTELFASMITREDATVDADLIAYGVQFKRLVPSQRLLGYDVLARVVATDGETNSTTAGLSVSNATRLVILVEIQPDLSDRPLDRDAVVQRLRDLSVDYDQLLSEHAAIHGEMFGRVALALGDPDDATTDAVALQEGSRVGATDPALVQKAFEAGRYAVISSTGRLPPALQGIWTGTWKPNWSGDFTLNGNLQSAVASSLSGNHYECLRAALEYLSGMMDDFRTCAQELFGFRGIWIPWRSSTHGQCHYAGYRDGHNAFPGTYWYASMAWWAWHYYDYWLHTHDQSFFDALLKPFFLESALFYEDYLSVEQDGRLVLVPSYSPENDPANGHGLQPNATMTIAAIRQFARTLLSMAEKLEIDASRRATWTRILAMLPDYQIEPDGALSEWAWPGVRNQENHRHASHLYPVFDGVSPEIAASPELQEACRVAIDKRLEYRRDRNGAEMAFGLTQLGMSASYLRDTQLAYECLEWMTNSYWSPAMVSQHDPGAILNVDISGGLPALVINMLVQSFEPPSADDPWEIHVLPCLPDAWPRGSIAGVRCRGGFEVSVRWSTGSADEVRIRSLHGAPCRLTCNGATKDVSFADGLAAVEF